MLAIISLRSISVIAETWPNCDDLIKILAVMLDILSLEKGCVKQTSVSLL
jgi:hypothetical protein